jgi:hypothetical protein
MSAKRWQDRPTSQRTDPDDTNGTFLKHVAIAIAVMVGAIWALGACQPPQSERLPPGTERCWDNLGGQPEPC